MIRSKQSLPRGPGETAPGQNVCVYMVDRLTAIASSVEDDTEAIRICATDFRCHCHHLGCKSRITRRQRCNIVVVIARNDQHVHGRLGIDVVEGDHPIGRMHD